MLRLMFEADDEGLTAFGERVMCRDLGVTRYQARVIRKSLMDKGFITEPDTVKPPDRTLQGVVKVCDTDCCKVIREAVRPSAERPVEQGGEDDAEMDKVIVKGEAFDIRRFVEFWNETMTARKSVIPTISKVGKTRRGLILGRLRENGKMALAVVTQKCAVSDFLNGRNNSGFIANFDWVFKPTNFIKVLDGNYDNNGQANQRPHTRGVEERKQRADDAAALINHLLDEND